MQNYKVCELYTPNGYLESSQYFASKYNLIGFYYPPDQKSTDLKQASARKCLFCDKSVPDTTFKSEAHLIPELLGNKTWLSDFECDVCNSYFDRECENDLTNYLGITRTLQKTQGKRGVPSYTSLKGVVSASNELVNNKDSILINRRNPENNFIEYVKEESRVILRVPKNSFRPLRVYKALMKIALSVLPEPLAYEYYQLATKFLLERNISVLSGLIVTVHQLPLFVNYPPHALLFEKKEKSECIHTHVVNFYVNNFQFSLPLLLNKLDIQLLKAEKISMPVCPPYIYFNPKDAYLGIRSATQDFSSDEKIKGLVDEIYFQFDPEELKQSYSLDVKTGNITRCDFDPSAIMKMLLQSNETGIDPQNLSSFFKTKFNL